MGISSGDTDQTRLGNYILTMMVAASAQIFPREDLMEEIDKVNLKDVDKILSVNYRGMFKLGEFGYVPDLGFADGTRGGFITELDKQIKMKEGFKGFNREFRIHKERGLPEGFRGPSHNTRRRI